MIRFLSYDSVGNFDVRKRKKEVGKFELKLEIFIYHETAMKTSQRWLVLPNFNESFPTSDLATLNVSSSRFFNDSF